MKRIALVFGMAILLLVSCENTSNPTEKKEYPPEEVEVELDDFKTLEAESSKFHFVAGWLNDSEIVFVEKEDSDYNLKTFNVNTGEIYTLFKESMIIVDAIIHPNKEMILLHTSTNSTSANVKMISLEGIVLDEISIASSELAIEWNDLDPNLILLTAFYQDWTYDVFLFNGREELKTLELEDPFPKWLGSQILTVHIPEHPLDGGSLHLYDWASEIIEPLPYDDIVHFDTYKNSLLIVQIVNGKAEYEIIDQEGSILNKWTLPAVSNYSEWVFPDLSWIDNETIITLATKGGGELDNLSEPFMLVKLEAGEQVILSNDSNLTSLKCSPDGEKCLTGNSSEKLIDIVEQEEFTWLLLNHD
ncbi:hypothetical protein JSQ81_01250 [Sporosarcina sp. Marseille-Q4063]|uniref:YqgU-like beta propeller domain-containing protein n=1 Tax=Sporosarcina sp. Marseille-Q4063 TaxID=2810514 RepID=UPI001BAF2DFF|nr:hypothetical protein [Sporosarcina sp. Marseille-Q4063]QUW22252.1 hypothetical protein JSQ81_01250 [Sporosarcina sp. Marseille-Q4063]